MSSEILKEAIRDLTKEIEEHLHAGQLIAEVMRDFVEDGYIIADDELVNAIKVFFPDADLPFVKEDE